ncbi:MAG: hypothetical protein ACK5T0_02530 [Vampirovibrionales bacterium]
MGMINAGFSQGFSMFGFPRNRNGSSDFFNRPSLMALSNMASNPPVDADGFVDMNYLKGMFLQEKSLLLRKTHLDSQQELVQNIFIAHGKRKKRKEALEKKLQPVWFA